MAGGGATPTPSGGGGKKAVDFQLNLVPFIDLLSVLISFLLLTAVWTQIARIEVQQQPNLPSNDIPDEEEREQLKLTVVIKASGYLISVKEAVYKDIPKTEGEYDSKTLREVLETIVGEHPENNDVIITAEDRIEYQELITVMDLCLENDLQGISVSGVSTS